MVERQAARGSHQLACCCGSTVESRVWQRLQQSQKTNLSSERREAAFVRETISHPYEMQNALVEVGQELGGDTNEGEGTTLSLLAHQPHEILSHIFSFCPVESLASLDLTCTDFRQATPDSWEARARQRFGSFGQSEETTGKAAYQKASALLRPEKAVIVPLPWGSLPVMSFSGTPSLGMSQSGRILVTGSDDHAYEPDENLDFFRDAQYQNSLIARDLRSGDYGPVVLDGRIPAWEVAVVGADHEEIVINSQGHKLLHAQRINPISGGMNRLEVDMESVDRKQGIDSPYYNGGSDSSPKPMYTLGCATMAVVARRGHFFVYVPDVSKLLKLVHVTRIDANDESVRARGMTWLQPEVAEENTFCCSTHPGRIRVWRAELQSGASSAVIHNILDIQTPESRYCFYAIAVTDKYIAASPGSTKRISVYNHNGTVLSSPSEGLNESDYMNEGDDDFVNPLCMFATGEILVTSSVAGAALCIWDMWQGVLLHRLTDLFDIRRAPLNYVHGMLPGGDDFASLVPLVWKGAICVCWRGSHEFMWEFPGNQDQYLELKAPALSRKEEALGRAVRSFQRDEIW